MCQAIIAKRNVVCVCEIILDLKKLSVSDVDLIYFLQISCSAKANHLLALGQYFVHRVEPPSIIFILPAAKKQASTFPNMPVFRKALSALILALKKSSTTHSLCSVTF